MLLISVHRPAVVCLECGAPFSKSQIERIIKGQNVICEICGYEFMATSQDFRDLAPAKGMESRNLYRPEDLFGLNKQNQKRIPSKRVPPFSIFDQQRVRIKNLRHPKINTENILKYLKLNEWISLSKLGKKFGIVNKRELYILRMNLNGMNHRGLIQMDFQVNRILIRKK
ncbi:MAG: hypothetical protein ACTSWY_04570 [Promethearchaeota archaeon]